mmetsp:Transcript_33876/g.89672  ORF Transcript_33876/g.89672 Transcript_33876/m.89672 type:complete len:136 (+) Transcript_33876:17-424(+)
MDCFDVRRDGGGLCTPCPCAATNRISGQGAFGGDFRQADQRMCGVGINFIEDRNRALYVKSLAKGGPAENCGLIQTGDVLYEVQRNNVYCLDPERIGGLLLGQEGTQVELGFMRNITDPDSLYRVSLRRAQVPRR